MVDAGADPTANHVEPLLSLRLAQERGAGVAAVGDPEAMHGGRQGAFDIEEKDVFELILTPGRGFLPRVVEGVDRSCLSGCFS
jgi:hypothetical protein